MLQDKNLQYINIKKYDKQLKIDNQILKSEQLIKTEHSSFLIENELSSDAISKLNILQQDINKTYISTLNESLNQKVVDSNNFLDDTYTLRKLSSYFSVAIPKEDIEAQKDYFKTTGIDYIFSPYALLHYHMLNNGLDSNSLNILILNNIMYAIILDEEKKIAYCDIKTLTPFDKIKESEFYTQELESQQLFDEVHLLEVQNNITSFMNEFYETNTNHNFCENISIFYFIRQLNDEQLENLNETLMMEINYSSFPLDNLLFTLAKQQNSLRQSFIEPREKKEKKSMFMWVVAATISTLIVASVLYYMNEQSKIKQEQLKALMIKQNQELAQKKAQEELDKIVLPNHTIANYEITKVLLSIFDIIPYNAVLNELQLDKTDSTFVCTLLDQITFEKDMKQKLLKLYKTSDIILSQEMNTTYSTIISNTSLLPQTNNLKNVTPNYNKKIPLTQDDFMNLIKSYLDKTTKIKFISKTKTTYTTYNFEVKTTFKEPKDFFDFVENLNKLRYSVNLTYPIEFAQTTNGLETNFVLQFNQI